MFAFFRQIRNQFLQKGNSHKYIVYAIGEIALVVIGILIALQINNWNEGRKDRLLEQEYLNKLAIEMAQNKKYTQGQLKSSELQVINVDILLAAMEEGKLPALDSFFVALEHVCWAYPISHEQNIWDEMVNSGLTRLIRNDSLHAALAAYHAEIGHVRDLHKEWIGHNLGLRSLVRDFIPPLVREEIALKLHPTQYYGGLENLPDHLPILDQLRYTTGVRGYLADIKMGRRTNYWIFSGINDKIDAIISLCQSEIKD